MNVFGGEYHGKTNKMKKYSFTVNHLLDFVMSVRSSCCIFSGLWPWFIPEFKQSQGLVQSPRTSFISFAKTLGWNFFLCSNGQSPLTKFSPNQIFFSFFDFSWLQIFIIPAYFFFLWWFDWGKCSHWFFFFNFVISVGWFLFN